MSAAPATARRSPLDHILAALPVALVFLLLAILYAWESRGHKTPWLFGDELNLAQLSRSIQETGRAARRGEPHTFQTLYAYLLAPAWFLDDMHRAYSTVKYVGVLTMTAAVFPAYLLARIVVSRPAAWFAAAATAAIPALVYSPMLIPEALAYPYAALCFYLVVKALVARRGVWVVAATAASVVAPFVRGELALIPVVFGLAAAGLLWTGERGRAWRATWGAGDRIGALVLAVGALIVFNTVLGHHSHTWDIATGHYKHRMWTYGLWAAGAFTIGLGVLPVVAGLAALGLPKRGVRTREQRAFVAVAVSSILCFGLYAAVKAAYLSTVFATRVEERNLIYLAPLLLASTAFFFDQRRLRPWAVAAAGAFAYYVLVTTPYQLESHFYSDAPGLSILQMANRNLAFTPDTTRWALRATLLVALGLIAGLAWLQTRRRPWAHGLATVGAGLVVAWCLAGQIPASNGSNELSEQFLRGFPSQTDWVDRATGGAPTMYLGQNVSDANGLWTLEFWNRSIRYVWSLDGTAPGPGPTETPNVDALDGHLQQQRGELKYVVAEAGTQVRGEVVAQGEYLAAGQPALWNLYRINYPLRLRRSVAGLYSDAWMGRRSSFNQYVTASGKRGYLIVNVSREGWGGKDIPGNVTIRVGTLRLGARQQPHIGQSVGFRRFVVHSHQHRRFVFEVPAPPIRAEVEITPTFVPNDLDPRIGDRRPLGAVVSYEFTETRPGP